MGIGFCPRSEEFGGGDVLNWDCLFDLSILPVLVNFNSQSVLPMMINLNSQSVLPILVNFNYQSVLSILQVTECSSIGILILYYIPLWLNRKFRLGYVGK